MKSRNSRGSNGYIGNPYEKTNESGVISANKTGITIEALTRTSWQRANDWLPLPNLVRGDERFCGLLAVFPGPTGYTGPTGDAQYLAFQFGTTVANYIVDWGDGITESFPSGATAKHRFYYTGLSASSETTLGFRQALVQVYPQGTTGQLLYANFQAMITGDNGVEMFNYDPGWLDMKIAGLTASWVNLTRYVAPSNKASLTSLHQFEYVGPSNITTSQQQMFASMGGLKRIIGTEWTRRMTSGWARMFYFASSLRDVPLFDMNAVTNITNLGGPFEFSGMQYIPFFDLSRITTGSFQLGYEMSRLKYCPPLNTSGVSNFNNAFQGTSLREAPYINTENSTSVGSMFRFNYYLRKIPLYDTAKCQSFGQMCDYNYSLTELPPLSMTGRAGSIQWMLRNCYGLSTLPALTITGSAPGFFQWHPNLNSYPNMVFNTTTVTSFDNIFYGADALTHIPLLNAAGATNFNGAFTNCYNLRWGTLANVVGDISYHNCCLSPTALEDIFTNLSATAATGSGKVVTISGNWGANFCNKSIATAKGWTVVG